MQDLIFDVVIIPVQIVLALILGTTMFILAVCGTFNDAIGK